MTEKQEAIEIMSLVSEVVAAYLSNNEMPIDELPAFIQQIHRSLCGLKANPGLSLPGFGASMVSIEDSIQDDYLVCLEDGKRLKMLKRHLRTAYNLTPQQYRERWGLPHDYPMVAPNYAKRRSDLAKNIGLGTQRTSRKKVA